MKEHLPLISKLDLRSAPYRKVDYSTSPPIIKQVPIFERLSNHVKTIVKGGEK